MRGSPRGPALPFRPPPERPCPRLSLQDSPERPPTRAIFPQGRKILDANSRMGDRAVASMTQGPGPCIPSAMLPLRKNFHLVDFGEPRSSSWWRRDSKAAENVPEDPARG